MLGIVVNMLHNNVGATNKLGNPEEDECETSDSQSSSDNGDESESDDKMVMRQCPFSLESLESLLNGNGNGSANASRKSKANRKSARIYEGFKLPIEYLNKKEIFSVSDIVSSDLELVRSDASFCTYPGEFPACVYSGGVSESATTPDKATIYEHFIQPTNVFSGEMTRDIQKRYTTNTEFLKETQMVLSQMDQYTERADKYMTTQMQGFVPDTKRFLEIWRDTKENARFLDTYSYLEWPVLEHLNHSAEFLQAFSFVNILSPVFSLMTPFVCFIAPFVLLRLKRVEITIDQYVDTLRDIARNHFIGRALSSEFTIQGIAYLLLTFALYALQTYQNVNSCIRYYTNLTKVNGNLEYMRDHLKQSIVRMNTFVQLHNTKPHYREFCSDISKHTECLLALLGKLDEITPFSVSYSKMTSIGHMLQCYYQLYSNPNYEESIRYSLGFGAYMDILVGIHTKLRVGQLGNATFSEDNTTTIFYDQYYPTHSYKTSVKNTCNLSKNMIITGVNASGKTTFIKTTTINILLTQQFGIGFYSGCVIRPYTHIHSYLNIPDTSGRDSLFQAESRRCKQIIDAIESSKNNPDVRHFAIFDELYSGTNPDEATKSAVSLLRYLSSFGNVRFMLTTHYLKVCRKFRRSDKISNYKMNVKQNETGKIQYLYTIKKGVSKIQGGVEILKMMNYPEEILQDIQKKNT